MNDSKLPAVNRSQSPTLWAFIVFIFGMVARLLVLLLYQPVAYSDTPSYRRLAETVLDGFANYDGTRTPGYPVFLALTGSDQVAWLVQLMLGLVTTMLLFYIGWKLTARPWFGGVIGLAHTFNLGQLLFESNLLTESLTTFLLILTMTLVLIWHLHPQQRRYWLVLSIGLTSTLTLLVRPLFIYLPFYIFLFLWVVLKALTAQTGRIENEGLVKHQKASTARHFSWHHAIAFLLPVILLLGGWMLFIHERYGDWSLTTMTGYHLIQHTGAYFEYVPDEYASLRDTYIQFRDAQIAQYGTQANTIWEAIPEMSRVSGYNFYDLSRVLVKISIQLILQHPLLFIQNTLSGWWMFWRTSFYWSAEAVRFSWLADGLDIVILIQRAILFLSNVIFISASIYFASIELLSKLHHPPERRLIRFIEPEQRVYFWFLLGTIWIASILQTLLDHGDNPRFLVPLQSLVVLWVAWFFYQWAHTKHAQNITITSNRD